MLLCVIDNLLSLSDFFHFNKKSYVKQCLNSKNLKYAILDNMIKIMGIMNWDRMAFLKIPQMTSLA